MNKYKEWSIGMIQHMDDESFLRKIYTLLIFHARKTNGCIMCIPEYALEIMDLLMKCDSKKLKVIYAFVRNYVKG